MEISPQRVRTAEFKTVRKGADPDEVKAFLGDVADELERAQNQSTAMEARARAAVARLQELSEGGAAAEATAAAPESAQVAASVDESETISRTLLLAQRTADTAVADARAQAEQILAEAKDEAARTLDSTREMSASMLDEARVEARQAGEAERAAIAGEVEALKARRDFLESDVQHLETFLVDQRARLREAASSITDIVDRVPGGLGEVRAPLLSAADDDTGELDRDPGDPDEGEGLTIVTDLADRDPGTVDTPDTTTDTTTDTTVDTGDDADGNTTDGNGSGGPASARAGFDDTPPVGTVDDDPWDDGPAAWSGDDTVAMPVTAVSDDGAEEEFRFSFDDERS